MIQTGLYKHSSSSKQYNVLGVCRHSETLEVLVVYQALYGDFRLWVRPIEMFTERVTVNNQEVPRFQYVAPTFNEPATLRD